MPRNLLFWGMVDLNYLVDREREEELRTSTRSLTFPDGEAYRIETYRLVWQWYDRLVDCDYSFEDDEIIAMIPRCAGHEGLEYDQAFIRVVAVLVGRMDRDGIDVTSDTLQLDVARKQMAKWNTRKTDRQGRSG